MTEIIAALLGAVAILGAAFFRYYLKTRRLTAEMEIRRGREEVNNTATEKAEAVKEEVAEKVEEEEAKLEEKIEAIEAEEKKVEESAEKDLLTGSEETVDAWNDFLDEGGD